ncbi:MAG: insulinase family protein [Eubacteriales bacterium]|nr:insulinase family protein [Eubacteriales bacterium]
MPKAKKKLFCMLLCMALAMPLLPLAEGEGSSFSGFKHINSGRLELVSADVNVYEHEKTGALVMTVLNEDTNRTFDINFRTVTDSDMGIPHVFEHATLDGSQKYPSKSLFFNLIHQSYNTYLNAFTMDIMTSYPSASLSEDQLIKYADYYLDSVFNPLIMNDESIFKEEAWRYSMADKDSPLTLAGTVYTEMQGAYTIERAADLNFKKTLFPGSVVGNSYGGHPEHIPNMSWEDLKAYHDTYYHPSNSLTILYGKLEQLPAFFELLNEYFSSYEKVEIDRDDTGYKPLSSAVEATFDFPVEMGSDTANGSVVYYGFLLLGADKEDEKVVDLFTTLLNEQSSVFQQQMKEKLPQASAAVYYDNAAPDIGIIFYASGLNPDEKDSFRNVVDESLKNVAEKGFDKDAVEAVAAATRLDLLLSTENPNVGPNVMPLIAYYWTASDDLNAFAEYVDNTANFVEFAEQGKYQALIEKYMLNKPVTALVLTQPKAGLKEEIDSALEKELSERKAKMTEEEIAAIVSETAKAGEETADDSSQYVSQLQAVTVESLPVEKRIYDISDETGEDGVRRLNIPAEVMGVGQSMLLLDASSIEQEDIHYFKLYTDLLGRLDTESHDNAALSSLMTRYLYNRTMRVFAPSDKEGKTCHPKLRVDFIAMDEDFAPAYDLVYEMLFESNYEDTVKVKAAISQIKTELKNYITNNAYIVLIRRALASANAGTAYYNCAIDTDYYAFLEKLEKSFDENPQGVIEKITAVRENLRNKNGAIVGFAGNADSQKAYSKAIDAFLSRLKDEERKPAVYNFPAIAKSEALIIDSAVQYNLIFANYEDLGIEKYTGALNALASLVSDTYLYPLLRDQYGAYGVLHEASDYGVYIMSYRDPNIVETFDVYGSFAEKLAANELSAEALQGYILSAYSLFAQSQGELVGALNVMADYVGEYTQQETLKHMEELKAVTPEQIKEFSALYKALHEKGLRATAGGARAINEHSDLYDNILNPFAVVEKEQSYSDLPDDAWYKEAVSFVLDNKLMEPVEENLFGADKEATVGEYAQAIFALVGGGSVSAEEAVKSLAQFKLIPASKKAEDLLTRKGVAELLQTLLAASGQDITEGLEPLPEAADADKVPTETENMFRFLLQNDLLRLTDDNTIAPESTLSRAELAHVLYGLSK